jgi:hypothetical protein
LKDRSGMLPRVYATRHVGMTAAARRCSSGTAA